MAQTPDTFDIRYGDGSSTQFSFNFPYLKADEVFVEVAGEPTGFSLLTPNTVEITPAPADGAEIYIYRNTAAERVSYQFQLGAPFLPRYVDENFSQLLYAIQEGLDFYEQLETRSLRVPEPTGIPELPDASTRANKFLTFDQDGKPTVLTPAADSAAGVAQDLAEFQANLASNNPTQGSDLIAHTGTSDTVTEALGKNAAAINQRTIYVGSVAELEALTGLVDGQEVIVSDEQSSYKYDSGLGSFSRSIGAYQRDDLAGLPTTLMEAISRDDRTSVSGIFTTGDKLTGFRAGKLGYRKQAGGKAELLTDLSKFYPVGAAALPQPPEPVSVQFEIPPGGWVTTGASTIFRYEITGWLGITDNFRSTLVDASSGRSYSREAWSGGAYSYYLYNRVSGRLTVEVNMPTANAPANTLKLAIEHYPQIDNGLKQRFVDPVNGRNIYSGLAPDYAYSTISAALADDPDVIFITPGVYDYSIGGVPGVYTKAKDVAIKCIGGRASFISTTNTFSAYTLDQGTTHYTNISGSSTPVGVIDLLDLDEFGVPVPLSSAATLTDCRTTPGTYFYDSAAGRMYVNLFDGRVPGVGSVRPYNVASTFRHSAAAKVYLENIDFISGDGGAISARNSSTDGVLVAKNCRFIGNGFKNGADILDIGLVIFDKCGAMYNKNDGFNYTEFNGISPHFVEIDCYSYRNQEEGTGNGTTSHNACVGFRINHDTAVNRGIGVADVDNAITYNVNCTSRDNGPDLSAAGFRVDGAALMYLDGASAGGNAGPDFTATGPTAKLVARDIYGDTLQGTVDLLT